MIQTQENTVPIIQQKQAKTLKNRADLQLVLFHAYYQMWFHSEFKKQNLA